MNKIFAYILTATFGVLALSSCHDFKDDYMVDDSVYLRSATDDLLQEVSVYDATNRIGVIKAGKGRTAATVVLGIAPTDRLADYNTDKGTMFLPLDKSLYNADAIEERTVSFAAADARQMVDITWDPRAMVEKMTSETDDFVIPLCIKAASLAVSETKDLLLVRPILSTLTVRAEDNAFTCKNNATFVSKAGIKLDNPIPGHDVKVKLSFTPKAVSVDGLSYVAAPEGSITLVKDEVTIHAGDIETDIEVKTDMDAAIVPASVSYVAGEIHIDSVQILFEDGSTIDYMPVLKDKMVVRVRKTS